MEIVIDKGKQKTYDSFCFPGGSKLIGLSICRIFSCVSYFWQLKNPHFKKRSDCGQRKTRIAIAEWDNEATLLKWFWKISQFCKSEAIFCCYVIFYSTVIHTLICIIVELQYQKSHYCFYNVNLVATPGNLLTFKRIKNKKLELKKMLVAEICMFWKFIGVEWERNDMARLCSRIPAPTSLKLH